MGAVMEPQTGLKLRRVHGVLEVLLHQLQAGFRLVQQLQGFIGSHCVDSASLVQAQGALQMSLGQFHLLENQAGASESRVIDGIVGFLAGKLDESLVTAVQKQRIEFAYLGGRAGRS